MRRHTVRQALLARLPRAGDERGSLPMLMLVIIATVALGALLLSSVINQSEATRFDQTRVRSLHAAETGIDAMLARIRSAVGSDGTGDDSQLPNFCPKPYGSGVSLTGTADDKSLTTYSATVQYWTADPRTGNPDVDEMVCTSAGPYNPHINPTTRTPRFAVITSTGVDHTGGVGASVGRTVQSTYVFETNDINITGGQIRIFPSGSSQWCMDAGSNPTVGSAVLLQACSTSNPPAEQQVWAYRTDLSIELVSTANTTTPLCIDTNPNSSHTAGEAIVVKKCVAPDSAVCPAGVTTGCTLSPWNQQWSVDDNAHLEGAKNTTPRDIDGYCINAPSQGANVALTLASCAGGVTDTAQTWIPAPTAGAGMAGPGNQQLVNYKQFAMCLDDTGQDVNAPNMILYTCKQNPNPANVRWNQKYTPSPALGAGPTKVLLKVTTDSTASVPNTTFCLKSPESPGGYPVLVRPCPSSVGTAGPGFAWTVNQKYVDSTKTAELSYADKYTIHDDVRTAANPNGLCLAPGNNNDLWSGQYYKVIVTGCDGSTGQKWNADPSLDAATVTNTHEITASGG
jgi:hypothetical protein